jgi:hypothetical protein
LRDLPELLVYHHRLRQGDRIDWVWGILFSDLVGKHFYRAFAGAPGSGFEPGTGDPFLANLSTRILQDESRHLAFAEHYLRRNLPRVPESRRLALLDMRDELFRLLEAMTARVRDDAAELNLDADLYLGRVWADIEAFGQRIGLTRLPGPPSAPPPPVSASDGDAYHIDHHAERHADDRLTSQNGQTSVSDCVGCLLSLICGRRLALA